MKKNLFTLLSLIVVVEGASAQDTLKLTLQDAMSSIMRNNKEIALAELDQESAAARWGQTNAVFLPQVNLSYTAMTTTNPLNAFGFKLQQRGVSPADFNPELLNNPPATQNYTTKVEWNQPLINLDLVYQRKAAREQVEVYYYKTERTKEHLTFEMQRAYAQLQLSYQAVSVLKEALITSNSVFNTSQDYFEQGYLQKSDLLLVQVQVASLESKLAEANSNVRNASDYISLLMGVQGGAVYTVDPLEKVNESGIVTTQVPDDRTDFKALTSALEAQEIIVKATRMSLLPRLNAFANYLVNDKTATGFGSGSYLIGLQFSWNIFNGTSSMHRITEQKIAYSRIEQQLSYQKEQSQLELNKALRQLQDAKAALQQHDISVKQAAEALRILQNRFEQGLVSTNDVLTGRSALSEQKLLRSETVFKYNTTRAYLHFLTSTHENK
jgi:outer membrane protein TolC